VTRVGCKTVVNLRKTKASWKTKCGFGAIISFNRVKRLRQSGARKEQAKAGGDQKPAVDPALELCFRATTNHGKAVFHPAFGFFQRLTPAMNPATGRGGP
jgi:hypothetical protein